MAGRKPFIPSNEQRAMVQALLLYGVPIENIRRHVINPQTAKPVSFATFTRAFRADIATAVERANGAVTANLYRLATSQKESSPVIQAIVFWMRTRGGWKFADAQTAPPAMPANTPAMVNSEENARAIIEDVLSRWGRKRLMG